jgi:hypothetical protein
MKLYIAILTGEEDAVLADKMVLIEKNFDDRGSFAWQIPPLELEKMVKLAEQNEQELKVDKHLKTMYDKVSVDKSENKKV